MRSSLWASAPRATLTLTACPDGIRVGFPATGANVELDPDKALPVRLGPVPEGGTGGYVIHVSTGGQGPERLWSLGWGGRTNCHVRFRPDEGWVVTHAGHALPIRVNGEEERGERRLRDGDRIEPAVGLVLEIRVGANGSGD